MTIRSRRWIQFSIAAAAVVGGLLLAIDATRYVAYVAAYSAVAALLIGFFLLLVGLVLLLWSRTRWVGMTLSVAAVCFYGSFLGMMAIFAHSGTWSHERMVHFGPDVPADLVVLLQDDVDESAVNRALNELARRGNENENVGQTMIVYVGKHQGYAFTFKPGVTAEQRQAFKANVLQSDMVWRVYDSIAPDRINLGEEKNR